MANRYMETWLLTADDPNCAVARKALEDIAIAEYGNKDGFSLSWEVTMQSAFSDVPAGLHILRATYFEAHGEGK